MRKTVGMITIEVSDQAYPVWIRLLDGEGKCILSLHHQQLCDLHYAIHAADNHARKVLSDVPGNDYSKEMIVV